MDNIVVRVCPICNKPKNRWVNHEKCSKELKKIHAGKHETHRNKKLGAGSADYLAERYT
jgi:NMD protein affecting ribosome stability and mRNA decay